ncbi:MAG: 50S ribosomal protein L9 [Myxococcota bacterium]|nr:50S ribosomal protein L9 [Myxococcota bacterium]
MQVILMEDMPKLGAIGDLVNVKDGYARNFLFPNRKAVPASIRNVKKFEHEKRVANYKLSQARSGAEGLAKKIAALDIKLTRKVGEHDKLFGSVTSIDLERALEEQEITIDRRRILLGDPIKQLGDFEIAVQLHKEVQATLKVSVLAES